MLFRLDDIDPHEFLDKLDDMEKQYLNPPVFSHEDRINMQRFFYATKKVKEIWGDNVTILPPCNDSPSAFCYIKIDFFTLFNEEEKLQFIDLLALFDMFSLNNDEEGGYTLSCGINDVYY